MMQVGYIGSNKGDQTKTAKLRDTLNQAGLSSKQYIYHFAQDIFYVGPLDS